MIAGDKDANGYEYLGNFSAVDPVYSVGMSCHDCKVLWTGCWDNFQCPRCGNGELPSMVLSDPIPATHDHPDDAAAALKHQGGET